MLFSARKQKAQIAFGSMVLWIQTQGMQEPDFCFVRLSAGVLHRGPIIPKFTAFIFKKQIFEYPGGFCRVTAMKCGYRVVVVVLQVAASRGCTTASRTHFCHRFVSNLVTSLSSNLKEA